MAIYNKQVQRRAMRKSAFDERHTIATRKTQREIELVSAPLNPRPNKARTGATLANGASRTSKFVGAGSSAGSSTEDHGESFSLEIRLVDDQTLTPLTVPSFDRTSTSEFVAFDISVREHAADHLKITISTTKAVICQATLTKVAVGSHRWTWDGYNTQSVLDTRILKQSINVKVEGEYRSALATAHVSIKGMPAQVAWADVVVDRPSKKIITYLRPHFTDGGVQDLAEGKHPKRSYDDLVRMAQSGIEKHWSRAVSRHGSQYVLAVETVNSLKNCMDDIGLIYNAGGESKRSSNTGAMTANPLTWAAQVIPERIFYNESAWPVSDSDFMVAAAHEIGHEILKSYGGAVYSYGHKGTSNVVTQKAKAIGDGGLVEPSAPTEIDLMKYYHETKWPSNISRTKASELDALSLLWLAAVKFE